jgi:hypothetical protein
VAEPTTPGPLAKFAELHGLAFAPSADLPAQGNTLTRDGGKAEGTASGTLPGGIEGTLVHFTYVYTWNDSDNRTQSETRRFTLVVTRIPESIGFIPGLGFAGPGSQLSANAGAEDMAPIHLDSVKALKRWSAFAYKGTSESWLAQLLSPAMVEWLTRCDEDFGFELAGGVLCAGRAGHLDEPRELEALCADAAHLATAIREESLEEVGTGGASEAARDPDAADPEMEAALKAVPLDPPADVTAARTAFAGHLRRSPPVLRRALRSGLIWALVLNIPSMAVPLLLIDSGQYALLAAIEAALVGLIAFFFYRRRVRAGAEKFAAEAFYRAYADERELTLVEPLHFAATHAEAKLPFRPDRVLSGPLPGGAHGALVLVGDGSKRADRIAVVAGPKGPIAEAELQAEAPGISAKLLDGYGERLSGELAEDLATRPG